MLRHKMMMLFALAAITTLSVFSTNANAQCSDANVNRAIQEVTGRAPYRDADWNECTMFGNVSRLSYAALVNKVKGAGFCRDPWITKAFFKQTRSRIPAGWGTTNECNTKVYNEGSWGSFVLLRGYVNGYLDGVAQSGQKFLTVYKYNVNPNTNSNALLVIGALDSTTAPNARLLTKVETATGVALVGNDGASMVAAGGGNYAPGGTPMVAAGGGNVVPTGAGNLISNAAFFAPPSTIPMRLVNSTNSRNLPGRLRIKF
jgi:hypothetical protein